MEALELIADISKESAITVPKEVLRNIESAGQSVTSVSSHYRRRKFEWC